MVGLTWFVPPQVINPVRSRINRNPVQKQKIMAQEMDIAENHESHYQIRLGLSNNKQDNALPLSFVTSYSVWPRLFTYFFSSVFSSFLVPLVKARVTR